MKAFQFWILILISLFVSGTMIEQVFLTRKLNIVQRTLVDDQEIIGQGPSFENAWQKLALALYQVGSQDPAVLELLRNDNVGIRPKTPEAAQAPAPSTATPPKAPVPVVPPAVHPATP
jgi:hypothetical protein